MGLIFKNDLLDEFGTWGLGYIPYGGADFGELLGIANAVGDGDDSAFVKAFWNAAARFEDEGDEYVKNGNRARAKEVYLKAAGLYSNSYHPIYGTPVDPRIKEAFRKMTNCFNMALSLSDVPVSPMRIPFDDITLPAYFIPATNYPDIKRPLLLITNGYDGTIVDTYFAVAVAALERGYHCLLFDGPGQGEVLIEQNVTMRPDWEVVVKAVVDVAEKIPLVDQEKMAITGWSLGGYLSLRAASGEPRFAACVADPGGFGIYKQMRDGLIKFGADPEKAANPALLDQSIIDQFQKMIDNNPHMTWGIIKRGFWVNGAADLRSFLVNVRDFTIEGREELIKCPTLLTAAENDGLSKEADAVFVKLTCRKDMLRFFADRGAGDHCEMKNRTLLNRKVLDWLDHLFFQIN